MAEMEPCRYEKKLNGCGVKQICNSMFRRRSFWSRRASSAGSSPNSSISSRKRRGVRDEAAYSDTEANFSAGSTPQLKAGGEKFVVSRSPLNPNAGPVARSRYHVAEVNKPSSQLVTSSPSMVVPTKKVVSRNVPTLSGELEAILPEPRARGNMVRASSSNMMVFGHLGNIRQPVPTNGQPTTVAKENSKAVSSTGGGAKQGGVTGNVLRKEGQPEVNLCRVLSRRLEPEELKELGNEEFKKGKYNEALAYYDLAISMDSSKAAYRSNRSAALTGLGRLLEAVEDCKEAVKMEPGYHRAHHRLATLYLRLGDADKALNHYKRSGKESNPKEMAKAQALRNQLARSIEARKLRDWKTVLKEARNAVSSGADSAPQVLALQAEALLKLHRHEEADATFTSGPNFDPDALTKLFTTSTSAYYFLAAAQVDLAAGRFEEAVAAAQRASRLEPGSKDAGMAVRRARAVAAARSKGNELFKAGKYGEASAAYGEGLEQEQHNAVLLCNRAACKSKLGQWEKAVEDCTAALAVRPSYTKARRRRADCNAKLEKWEAAVEDYEMQSEGTAGDEEIAGALAEARLQLEKQRSDQDSFTDPDIDRTCQDVIVVASDDRFRQLIASPGLSVVLFCKTTKSSNKQASLIARLCERLTSVTFLKVAIDEHPSLAKSEGVSFVPCFNIYKGGSKVKYIDGDNPDLLESSIKTLGI